LLIPKSELYYSYSSSSTLGAIDPAAVSASSEVGFSVGVVLDLRLRVLVVRLVAAFVVLVLALDGDRSGKSSTLTSWINPPTSRKANTGGISLSLHSLQIKVIACLSPPIVSFLSSSTLFLPSTCAKVLVHPGHRKRWATSPLISAALTCLVLLVSLAILLWLMVCFARDRN
jgi:hypothetical protein